jgi:hypothetical protein
MSDGARDDSWIAPQATIGANRIDQFRQERARFFFTFGHLRWISWGHPWRISSPWSERHRRTGRTRGLAEFFEATGPVPANPDEFRTTIPNGYERLLDHINTHRWLRGIDLHREFMREAAVASWRGIVYRPMVDLIRRSGILEDFPGCTETDLYLYVMNHLHHLRKRYGAEAVPPERAVAHFAERHRERRRAGRLGQWLRRLRGRRDE